MNLLQFTPSLQDGAATLALDLSAISPHRVSPLLFGKFCEHLGYNIYRGMDAQILYNPTFGRISVADGLARGLADRFGWPDGETVLADYRDGAALGWFRVGTKEQVLLSPDAGPNRCFAQRVETPGASPRAPVGIGQWTYLPLARTRGYPWRLVARSVRPARVRLGIWSVNAAGAPAAILSEATVDLSPEWTAFTGKLEMPARPDADPNALFMFDLTTDRPANVVLGRVLLYPDDHIHGADPEVMGMLKEARLPILRWPGGNFVSAYHWRDGVGPPDDRPTMPNPVWGGTLEPNLFGTDEFIAYCRGVGCAPLICVNAGSGTPEEAAEWVQYCNGPADSPMGRLRARNGQPAPYAVKYWEIGNELFGRHQTGWTTPAGNVDRFLRFAAAMRAVDPTIRLLACGGLHLGVDAEWNRLLNRDTAGLADCQTHHILEGGEVPPTVDVKELYHAFMGYPVRIAADYRLARQRMLEAGIEHPRLAITELQLFAFIPGKSREGCPLPGRIPTPQSVSEALYLMLIVHECARLGELVEMVTHSATVNHGGGIRKDRQRVWGNPVHHAHVMGSALAGGRPVGVRLSCGIFSTRHEFGHLPLVKDCPDLDALAVTHDDGSLMLMLVHRSALAGAVKLTIDLGGFRAAGGEAELLTLSGRSLDDENTLDDPRRVVPVPGTATVANGKLALTLPPYSLTRVHIRPSGRQ